MTHPGQDALPTGTATPSRDAATLRTMLDSIRHGICLFDVQDRIVAANAMVSQLMDLPAELLAPGTSLATCIRARQQRGAFGEGPAAEAIAHRLITMDRSISSRDIRIQPDGRVVEVASDPTPDGGWVMTCTDVTEAHRIQAELEQAKNAAEAANRAKSSFLATMTHELRTPLNAVIGFSEAIRSGADPDRHAEFIDAIQAAGQVLLSLIDDILDVARAETAGFDMREADLALPPLVETVVEMMQAAADKAGVSFRLDLPPQLPHLRADSRRLRQVLLNLVSNAVKFSRPGGCVTIAAQHDWDGAVLLDIADTGIGIAPEDLSRLFEPFTQLDSSLARRFGGSGLGLYLSRVLAEAQGANLILDSTPGSGTIARLRFPARKVIAAR